MGEEDTIEDLNQEETARWGRCFKALFGMPSGPGALPTLRPLMAL
jgi:hypothetical protein